MDTLALSRPTVPRKLRLTLTAVQAAVAVARSEVRAAIRAWNVPVAPSAAALLTGELVASALRHEPGRTIELVISCAHRQLQVDVYDTSPAAELRVGTPAAAEAGRSLMVLDSLASNWGYDRTPTGRAGYFTLMF